MNIIFFGSTADSVIVATIFHAKYPITACITQPASPVGRSKTITKTPLELWATERKLPCLTFTKEEERGWKYKNEDDVVNSLATFKPDLFITACYGQKLPSGVLALPAHGALNIHPSLLPRWRGADPVPWTIIAGDAQTGVTILTITDTFDSGDIVTQKKISITEKDRPDDLRTRLFTLGAELLVNILPEYVNGSIKPVPQKKEDGVVARKLTRDDGYIEWNIIVEALLGKDVEREKRAGLAATIREPLPQTIVRLERALSPWPGIWTTIARDGKDIRVKLFDISIQDGILHIGKAQIEGKTPVDWTTFKHAYL
ncbi:MAG: methionyl-tRNA formyltransferase [Candidatus Gottesmanbacteria bacterium]